MLIRVGHLSGEVKDYNLADGASVTQLLELVGEQGFDFDLVCAGEVACPNDLLKGDFTYYILADLDGGKKKKKKKKAWATKKKIKHRHRKIKLLTLKLYSVDKNGTVQRTRKQCPNCPAGVYMAKHFDRHYCGTCHQTLKMDEATIKANLEALKKLQKAKADAAAAKGAEAAAAGGKKDTKKAPKKK